MNKAGFRFYVSQKERQISFTRGGKQRDYMLRNTNELLGTNGVEGVKTGRTARAGDCLILSAQRDAEVIKQGPDQHHRHAAPHHHRPARKRESFWRRPRLLAQGWQLYDQWAAAGRMVDPKKTL